MDRFIYVVPAALRRAAAGRAATRWPACSDASTRHGAADGETIMLLGPGRWGTASPDLGIPVQFAEINRVSVLCEIVTMRENLIPDVSLGTHFLNELVEMNMLYMALFPQQQRNYLNERFFLEAPNRLLDLVPGRRALAGNGARHRHQGRVARRPAGAPAGRRRRTTGALIFLGEQRAFASLTMTPAIPTRNSCSAGVARSVGTTDQSCRLSRSESGHIRVFDEEFVPRVRRGESPIVSVAERSTIRRVRAAAPFRRKHGCVQAHTRPDLPQLHQQRHAEHGNRLAMAARGLTFSLYSTTTNGRISTGVVLMIVLTTPARQSDMFSAMPRNGPTIEPNSAIRDCAAMQEARPMGRQRR